MKVVANLAQILLPRGISGFLCGTLLQGQGTTPANHCRTLYTCCRQSRALRGAALTNNTLEGTESLVKYRPLHSAVLETARFGPESERTACFHGNSEASLSSTLSSTVQSLRLNSLAQHCSPSLNQPPPLSVHQLRPKLKPFLAPLASSLLCRDRGSTVRAQPSVRHYASDVVFRPKVRGIQNDISPLTTKRIVPRKKWKDAQPREREVFQVTALSPADEFDLETLEQELQSVDSNYRPVLLPKDEDNALHVEAKYQVDSEPREIFFFREGTVVFWNMPEVEREAVLKFLTRHQKDGYDSLLVHAEYEYMEYSYSDSASNLTGGEIQLEAPQAGKELKAQLEKYAFSNALAQSVKLSIWEASLERFVDSIEFVVQDMKDGRKFQISRGDVLRKTGELFTLKHLINLSSDLLDEPDFYWDREPLVRLYSKTIAYLNVGKRTRVMNIKLDHCFQLTDLLKDHLNDKHHTRLEVMIIALILIEVLFELGKMVTEFMSAV